MLFQSGQSDDRLEQGLKNGVVVPVTAAAVLGTSDLYGSYKNS